MNQERRPRLARNLLAEPLDQELMIYSQDGGTVVKLNPSGALVVQLCNGERTGAEIADAIADAYTDAASDIKADVPEIIEELIDDGVLEWA